MESPVPAPSAHNTERNTTMRKIVLYMITTLDGFIAAPEGEPDVYEYEPTEEEHQYANDFFRSVDGILFGRVIYELFVSYWDTLDLDDPAVPGVEVDFATLFRKMTRVVVSRTLDTVDDNAIVLKDDIAGEVAKLKGQPGRDLALICGPELLATLVHLELVDEVRLLVRPLLLGRGKALFSDLVDPLRLELLENRQFGSGVVLHHYRTAYGA